MLEQAQLQRSYRLISLGFLLLVGLTLGGVAYAGWSRTTIEVTPIRSMIDASFTVTVSPDGHGPNGLTGTVTLAEQSATVTAHPDAEGVTEDAHAQGSVIIHNETGGNQALASGTRLQAASGVVVRTVTRVDVPARGQITVVAVADPLGTEGEIPAGRLTIVALRPANQSVIYGQVETPFAGGTVQVTGGLSVKALTEASNTAHQEITSTFGDSQPGHFRTVFPLSVSTDPKPEIPNPSYAVTVTAKTIEVAYDQSALAKLLTERLEAQVADDQVLVAQDAPTFTTADQPTLDSMVLTIKVRGFAELSPSSPLLQPSRFLGLNLDAITTKLVGSKLVKSVQVRISPWWRRNAPSQPDRIEVRLLTDS